MTNINDLDTSKTPVEVKEVKTPEVVTADVPTQLEPKAISDVLGLDGKEADKYHDKLGTILEWAKTKTNDHSLENLKWTVRELGFNLGSPPLGQSQVSWLAEYAYLDMESQKLNKRLEEFKHVK